MSGDPEALWVILERSEMEFEAQEVKVAIKVAVAILHVHHSGFFLLEIETHFPQCTSDEFEEEDHGVLGPRHDDEVVSVAYKLGIR